MSLSIIIAADWDVVQIGIKRLITSWIPKSQIQCVGDPTEIQHTKSIDLLIVAMSRINQDGFNSIKLIKATWPQIQILVLLTDDTNPREWDDLDSDLILPKSAGESAIINALHVLMTDNALINN